MQSAKILNVHDAKFFTSWDKVEALNCKLPIKGFSLLNQHRELIRLNLKLGSQREVEIWLRQTHPELLHLSMEVPFTGNPPAIGWGELTVFSPELICGSFNIYRGVSAESLISHKIDLGFAAGIWGIYRGEFHQPWSLPI